MKRLFLILLFSLPFFITRAQDFIYKKDNSKLKVKVLEINSIAIKYKSLNSNDSSIVSIPKSDVAIIIYENGNSEVIKEAPAQIITPDLRWIEREAKIRRRNYYDSLKNVRRETNKNKILKRKNCLYYNPVELIDGSFGISYVRNIWDNTFCLYLPISVGYGSPNFTNGLLAENKWEYKMNIKNYDAAVGLNFNLGQFPYLTPHIGIMYRQAYFNGSFNWNAKGNNFKLYKNYYYFTTGFRLRTTTHFSLMANLHIGFYSNYYLNTNSIAHYNILSGYKSGASFNFSIQLGFDF